MIEKKNLQRQLKSLNKCIQHDSIDKLRARLVKSTMAKKLKVKTNFICIYFTSGKLFRENTAYNILS